MEPDTQSTGAQDWDSRFVLNIFNKSRICFHERTTVILQLRVVSMTRRGRCLTTDWGKRIERRLFSCWNECCFPPLPAATCWPPCWSSERVSTSSSCSWWDQGRRSWLPPSGWPLNCFPPALAGRPVGWLTNWDRERSDWVWRLVRFPPWTYCFQLMSFSNHLRCRFRFT